MECNSKYYKCWLYHTMIYEMIAACLCNILHQPVCRLFYSIVFCTLESLSSSFAIRSSFVSLLSSFLVSFAVIICCACPACASVTSVSRFSISTLSATLTFLNACSKLGISYPCSLALRNLSLLTTRPFCAALTSFSNLCCIRCAVRSASVKTGGRSSTGLPNGATIALTT